MAPGERPFNYQAHTRLLIVPKRSPFGGIPRVWMGQNRWHAPRHRPSPRLGRGRHGLRGLQGRGPSESRVDRTGCAHGTDPPCRWPTHRPPIGRASRRRRSRGVGGGGANVGHPGNVGDTERACGCVARTDHLDVGTRMAGRFSRGCRRPTSRSIREPCRLRHVLPSTGRTRTPTRLGRPPLQLEMRRGRSHPHLGCASGRSAVRPAGSVGSTVVEGPSDGARCNDHGHLTRLRD